MGLTVACMHFPSVLDAQRTCSFLVLCLRHGQPSDRCTPSPDLRTVIVPSMSLQVLTHAVDLHGQLLLLVHWSILAYTGLLKILKKHHKRTGFPIRAPHLEDLLSQPFCSVEVCHWQVNAHWSAGLVYFRFSHMQCHSNGLRASAWLDRQLSKAGLYPPAGKHASTHVRLVSGDGLR